MLSSYGYELQTKKRGVYATTWYTQNAQKLDDIKKNDYGRGGRGRKRVGRGNMKRYTMYTKRINKNN